VVRLLSLVYAPETRSPAHVAAQATSGHADGRRMAAPEEGWIMPEGDVETYYANGKWRNRVESGDELPGEYDVKATAVAAGHDEAVRRKVEHIVRNLDGTVGERNSHRHDARPTPG
jgi:hypothetical protein